MNEEPTVFVSWSGDASKGVAESLVECLHKSSSIKTWISVYDISEGALWLNEITEALRRMHLGVVCLTRDNIHSGWIHFEAGALWRGSDSSRVIPYLFDVKLGELGHTPLTHLQGLEADRAGSKELFTRLHDITLSDNTNTLIDRSFSKLFWPNHKKNLDSIYKTQPLRVMAERIKHIERIAMNPGPDPISVGSKISSFELAQLLCHYCTCDYNALAGVIHRSKTYDDAVNLFIAKFVLKDHWQVILERSSMPMFRDAIHRMRSCLSPEPFS